MTQSLSCPLCGETLSDAALTNCPKCGGRIESDAPQKQESSPASTGSRTRVGDYFIECGIGSGGMGEVYLAKQISMKREVALKILHRDLAADDKYLERFFREVRLLAQIEHPNVVRAIEAGMEGDLCYFSMEYAHGKDIKRHIDLKRRFSEQETLHIAIEIASALKYAWDKHKLIHRDVKPANVILTPDGEVKLMDLGISKRQSENSEITLAGMMVGSPTYISPEQARAEKDMDFRADMYSLGASMFHMLAGEAPYDADSPVAVISMHLSAPIPDIRDRRPDISKATATLIMKMMAKDKMERYKTWDAAISQMEDILERRQSAGSRDAAAPDATRKAQRRFKSILPKAKGALSKASSPLETLAGWRPAILIAQPRHRIIALCVLLAIMLLAFASVVNRSVQDAKSAQESRRLQNALAAAAQCPPESRPEVIGVLELIVKEAKPGSEIAAQAQAGIKLLERRSLEERGQADLDRKAFALKAQKARSLQLENAGKFEEAIRSWNEYAESNDQRSSPEVKNALEYLKRMKKEKEDGLE